MKYLMPLGRIWLPSLLTVLSLFCPLSLFAQSEELCQLWVAKDVDALSLGDGVSRRLLDVGSESLIEKKPQSAGTYIMKANNSYLIRFADTKNKEWQQVAFPSKKALESRLNCDDLRAMKAWGQHERDIARSSLAWVSGKPSAYSLGETIIKLEHQHLWSKSLGIKALGPLVADYQNILKQVKGLKPESPTQEALFGIWRGVKEVLYSNKKSAIKYCYDRPLMLSALNEKCTNCQGFTGLFLSLFLDSEMPVPKGWALSVEVFMDHIRPVLYHSGDDRVFDLTDGRQEDRRSSIYDWKLYLLSMIKGSSLAFTESDREVLSRVSKKPIKMDLLCRFQRPQVGAFEHQMLSVESMKGCELFQEEAPPIEPTDLENLIDTPSGDEVTSGSVNGEGKEKALDGGLLGGLVDFLGGHNKQDRSSTEDYLRSLRARQFEDGAGGFLNVYLFLMGDYCGDSCRKELEKGASPNIEKLKGLVGDKDLEALRAFKEKESGAGEVLQNRFAKRELWERMGLLRNLGPITEKIHRKADISATCWWLKPIQISFDSHAKLPMYYRDGRILTRSHDVYGRIKDLDTIDRYVEFGALFKAEIEGRIEFIQSVFSGSLKEVILKQHQQSQDLREFLLLLDSYDKFLGRIFSDCILDAAERELIIEFFGFHRYSKIKDTIIEFRVRISENPVDFLEAIMQVLDDHPDIDKINPLFGYEQLEIRKTFTTSDWNAERSSFYREVIDYLILNPDYFYVPPGKMSESQVEFQDVFRGQKQTGVKNKQAGTNLPKLSLAPCKKDEVGYVQRGLFYIYCESEDNKRKSANKLLASDKDPRPEVVIKERYWPSIFALFDANDFEDHRLGLHHLYRPSLNDIYPGPRHILDTEVSHPGKRIHLLEASAINIGLQKGAITKDKAIEYMVLFAEESVNLDEGAPMRVRLRIIAQSEAIHSLKEGWHYLMVKDGSGDEIPGPSSWQALNESQYSPFCIQQRKSNLYLTCKLGVSSKKVRAIIESFYRKYDSSKPGQFILFEE